MKSALSFSNCLLVLCLGFVVPTSEIYVAQKHLARPVDQKPIGSKGAKSTTAEPSDQNARQRSERVLYLLYSIAEGSKLWNDKGAATRVQAQIADLTWDIDSDRSLNYLKRAWETSAGIGETTREASRFRNSSARTTARGDVIVVARRLAPELAKKWLEQMALEAESDKRREKRGAFDDRTDRSTLLLQMAMQIAPDNPDAAKALAIESLQDGISFGFQSVLVAIQTKDFAPAATAFRAALARLRTIGMVDPNELLILNAYLYSPGVVMSANTTSNAGSSQIAVSRDRPSITSAAQLDPGLAREFLMLAAELLLRPSSVPAMIDDPQLAARSQIGVISALLRNMEQEFPEQAAYLRTRMQQLGAEARFSSSGVSASSEVTIPQPEESREAYAERTVDAMERRAEKERDPLRRDIAFAKAAEATPEKQYERGYSLAERIQDVQLRNQVKNWLTLRASLYFAQLNELDKANQLSLKNQDLPQRAYSLTVIAERFIKAGQKARARAILEDVRVLLRKAEAEEIWISIALDLVTISGQIDPGLALDSLADAVKAIDQFPSLVIGSGPAPTFKRASGLLDNTIQPRGSGLTSAVEVFGPDEFESVLGVLERLTGPEVRGVAIMVLCKKFLRLEKGNPRAKRLITASSPGAGTSHAKSRLGG